MKRKKTKEEKYEEGNIPKLWPRLCVAFKENPEIFESEDTLRNFFCDTWPGLKNHKKCANCGESMAIYEFKLDFLDALLLKEMGDLVKQRILKGQTLPVANAVHVVSADFHDAVRHRTTQCAKLGLITKVTGEKGSHDVKRGWLITKRGFQALKGEEVPASVIVFRNRITERPGEMTTLTKVFAEYEGKYKSEGYSKDEYVHFAGFDQGELL